MAKRFQVSKSIEIKKKVGRNFKIPMVKLRVEILLHNILQCNVTSHLRVRFLLGGRHGDFKFLPPAGYSPCYEALLPKEKMHVEAVKEYKRDHEGVRDLLGTTKFLSQASFIPTPVDTSQVRTIRERLLLHQSVKYSKHM